MKLKYTLMTLAAMTCVSQAAVIVWEGSSTEITDTSSIINDGVDATNITYTWDVWPSGTDTAVAASGSRDFGGPGGTVNGVVIAAGGGGTSTYWTGNGGASTGDFTLDGIIDTHTAFGNSGDPWVMNLAGLQVNTQYKIQIVGIHDLRAASGISGRTTTYQDQSGGLESVALTRGTGGSVIGTFTTGAAETTFDIHGLGASDPGVSAVILRVVPEPSSTALLGLGGLALILRRRK